MVVARSASGSIGLSQFTIAQNNSAANVGSLTAGVTLGDKSSIQRAFDDLGHVASTTVSGSGGPAATQSSLHTTNGLVTRTTFPEGNVEERTYDVDNAIFRSR